MKPKVLVLRTAGTNCDMETAFAFEEVGAASELVHVNRVISGDIDISDYQIMAIPGGFTYGDDIASGKILANELKYKLKEQMDKFVVDGKLIIGICNGFQVLVKSGLLPGINSKVTLTLNDSAKFEDRWTYLGRKQQAGSKCIWTEGLPEVIYLPVAHGEGKFIPDGDETLRKLQDNGQVVFRYVDEAGNSDEYPSNPNGSVDNIAGICDPTGRIFGLMPHPERHIQFTQHPRWTRMDTQVKEGDGLQIFRNAVEYAKKELL